MEADTRKGADLGTFFRLWAISFVVLRYKKKLTQIFLA